MAPGNDKPKNSKTQKLQKTDTERKPAERSERKKNLSPAVPVDLTSLDDEQLQSELEDTVSSFEEISQSDTISEEDLTRLRELTARIEEVRAEQSGRTERAAEAQREIEEMTTRVRGQEGSDEGTEDAPEGDEEETEEGEGEGSEVSPSDQPSEGDGEGESSTVESESKVLVASRKINLANVRRAQKRALPVRSSSRGRRRDGAPVITASSDVPGIRAGETLDIESLTEAVMSKARAIDMRNASRGRSKGTIRSGKALVASYQLPFSEDLVVNSESSGTEGTAALVAASDQRRLPGGDLVAAGGWCSPSETVYDITEIACPDMLWGPPEVSLRRGGIRFFPTPTLVVDDLADIWTETEDEDAALNVTRKACFRPVCDDFIDARCKAVYSCIQAGILTERAFPELVAWYVRNAMVAHEIQLKRTLFTDATNCTSTQSITVDATFAAFSAVFGAVALQAADLVERHSLCDSISVEVVFPWWVRNLFLADIARQNGRSMADIDPAVITAAFAKIGISLSWARGLTPDVPTNIGGAIPPLGWPSSMSFLIYPAGAFSIGRGDVIDLGVIQDSNLYPANDYTALFVEECVTIVCRGPEARFVTVPICPDGETGSQASSPACPIDGGAVTT